MTGLAKIIVTMLLLLSAAAAHADAPVEPEPIYASLKDVVIGYYNAIAENRLEAAVRYYHSDSPEVPHMRTEIAFNQAAYLQLTATLSFTFISQHEGRAFANARHRFLRIAGLKFFEEFVEVAYVFRQQGGTWKLWMARIL